MDTVIGKKDSNHLLLVMTERLTRYELIFKIVGKKVHSVVNVLNTLENKFSKSFSKIFKSITTDNGSEFASAKLMEQSFIYKNKERTKIYYAHPFASYERGSNENQNLMIRRYIKKHTDINGYSHKFVRWVQDFINNYPRQLLGWSNSKREFIKHLSMLNISKFRLKEIMSFI